MNNSKSTEFQYNTQFTVYYFNDCIRYRVVDYHENAGRFVYNWDSKKNWFD